MRIEFSEEYKLEMEQRSKERKRKKTRLEGKYATARKRWIERGRTWLEMDVCPFEVLSDRYGLDGCILVADGKDVALVSVSKRWGTPVFWKVPPEEVMRDGDFVWVGGERDPRTDLPKWWWKWELTNEFGMMTYAGGHETGKDEVDFVATHWTFLPTP